MAIPSHISQPLAPSPTFLHYASEYEECFGPSCYLIEGAARLPEIKPHHAVVEHDGGTIEGDFLFGCVMTH